MKARKTVIISLFLASLLVSVVLLALAVSPPPGQLAAQDSEQEQIDQLWKDGEASDLFGPLDYSDGTATGKYIRFNYSQSTSTMSDVQMNSSNGSVPVIDSLAVTGLGSGEPNVTGPLFRVEGDFATLLVHNNPTDLIAIAASGAGVEVLLTFPNDAEITRSTEVQGPSYNVSVNGVQLWMLASNADVRATGDQMLFSFNDAGAMMIRQLPQVENVGTLEEKEIMSAIGNGLIGSEVWVLARSNGYVHETAVLNSVDTEVTAADVGSVTLEVSSQFQGGAIVLVNVDKSTIDTNSTGTVMVNGESIPNVDLTSVLESVLLEDTTPSFALLEGVNSAKFLIYLPDLSTINTVEIANT